MRKTFFIAFILASLVNAVNAAQEKEADTLTGEWILPDWGEAGEPTFPNRRLAWFQVPNRTVIYRKKLDLPASASYGRAEARIRTSGYVYVFVDGKEVFAHPHGWREGRRTPGGVYDVDLSEHFQSGGVHYIDVSVPAEGFAMTGLVGPLSAPGRPIVTDGTWRVTKLPPTSLIDWESSMTVASLLNPDRFRPGFKGTRWYPVRTDPARRLHTNEDALAGFSWSSSLDRAAKELDDLEWRARLLAERSIAVGPPSDYHQLLLLQPLSGNLRLLDPWQAHYAPPGTIHPAAKAAARKVLARCPDLRIALGRLRETKISSWRDLRRQIRWRFDPSDIRKETDRLDEAAYLVILDQGARQIVNADLVSGQLVSKAISEKPTWAGFSRELGKSQTTFTDYLKETVEREAAGLRRAKCIEIAMFNVLFEEEWGHPIGRYGESRSKYGWIPNAALVGGELGDWGIRLPAATVQTRIELPRRWRFSIDPDNQGLDRAWHTVGFNIENQWREIAVGRDWERQGIRGENKNFPQDVPYKEAVAAVSKEGAYNGYAWYRAHIHVPEQWRGQDIVLRIQYVNDWDWTYFNDGEAGRTGPADGATGRRPRTYVIPRDRVRFGGDNLVAVRVYDAGGPGGIGPVALECPALAAAPEAQATVEVIRSDLSPGILLETSGRVLTLIGAGKAASGKTAAVIPLESGFAVRTVSLYDRGKDGALAENWILLWPAFGQKERDRPVQLVFEKRPKRIEAVRDKSGSERVEIEFDAAGARVIAIRPVRLSPPGDGQTLDAAVQRRCRFWSRALLKYPVGFSELIRRDPNEPTSREVTTVYDFITIEDDWKTKDLQIAPLPVLLTYALKLKTPGVAVEGKPVDTELTLGKYGNYLALEGTRKLVYRYPLDRIKRLGGFTSWVFMPWDAGVAGNDRECEAVAQTGSNSYRPQFNFGGEKARIFADYCAKYGLTFIFNPDNNLGKKGGEHGENVDVWVEHYRGLATMFKDRPDDAVAYDLINEAANMKPEVYNPLIKRLTETIRKIDQRHVIYVETCDSWGAVEKFPVLGVTGDPRTVYSFHDYNFRLRGGDRWPTTERDIRNLYARWMPAIDFMIEHNVPIHLGEFGGFERGGEFEPCALTLLDDCFRIFDQFNWHFHYYPGRGIMWPRADGSLRPNMAAIAFRRYFDRGTFDLARAGN